MDISKVLLRTTFAKVLQFPDDYVFGRRQSHLISIDLVAPLISKGPKVQFIGVDGVNIRLQSAARMNQIELTTLSIVLSQQYLDRRNIKFRLRKQRNEISHPI